MKRLAIIVVTVIVAGAGAAGAIAASSRGHDAGPPTGTLTVDAQFPAPGSPQLSANLADPKGSPDDPTKVADMFAGNGKLFGGGKQVGTLRFDNVVTEADPARTILTVVLSLPAGDIVTEGATDLTSDAPSDFAVLGGTGAYGGARGTGHVVHLAGTDLNRAVLTFVR
jgi:hypothetical protein